MRILFDIGHPAHVHLFRNARRILQDRGHETVVVSRDKEVARDLAERSGTELIQVLGRTVLLWRRNDAEPKIELPG